MLHVLLWHVELKIKNVSNIKTLFRELHVKETLNVFFLEYKGQQFTHNANGDGSKVAKIIKR